MILPDLPPVTLPQALRDLADRLRIAADELEAERSDIRKARAIAALEESHARYLARDKGK